MPIHSDESCDCPEYCDRCNNGNCAACCPKCGYACPDCECMDWMYDNSCDCPCHSDEPSDKSLRQEERRQMGITG
jgi:hypothetical protein